jgi:hypothetical protein
MEIEHRGIKVTLTPETIEIYNQLNLDPVTEIIKSIDAGQEKLEVVSQDNEA